MSTNVAPLFIDADGNTHQVGADQTLTWNFTSGAGNPVEIQVGGSTYFTLDRNGAFALESNITLNTDAGGTIGTQYDKRPDAVHAVTTVAVGAITGVGDGASLTLNRVTLGHADVDKYIDAQQGLANTPFVRYNSVHHYWDFSNDGITATPIGAGGGAATTWDDIYSLDKTLDINATVLTFLQTSTTGIAFTVSRNLDAADTDKAIMLVEQQHATDDQPPLVLAQNAPTVSALDIYEGTYAAGTLRYSFEAAGRLSVSTSATLGSEAILITQNDDNQPYFEFDGTEAADASKNLSSANWPTAEMVRVEWDAGGGAATGWIPMYASEVLPGAPTWDAIYAVDKALTINAAALVFTQTNTSDYAFEINRNLDAADTDSAIVHFENQNQDDDKPALYIESVADSGPALQIDASSRIQGFSGVVFNVESGGITVGTPVPIFNGQTVNVTGNAGDTAATYLVGYRATGTGAGLSVPFAAFFVGGLDGFTWGLSSQLPVQASVNTATNALEVQQHGAGPGVYSKAVGAGYAVYSLVQGTGTAIYAETNGAALGIMEIHHEGTGDIISAASAAAAHSFTVNRFCGVENSYTGTVSYTNYTAGVTSPGLGAVTLAGFETDYTGAAGDVGSTYIGFNAVIAPAGGASTTYGFKADANWDYGFYSESPSTLTNTLTINTAAADIVGLDVTVDSANHPAGLLQQNGSEYVLRLTRVNDFGGLFNAHAVGNGATDFLMSANGALVLTKINLNTGYIGQTINITSTGLVSTVDGIQLNVAGHGTDAAPATYYGVEALMAKNGGTSTAYAFRADSGWDYGLYSQSIGYIAASSANPTLDITQSGVGDVLSLTGSGAGSWILATAGDLTHTPQNPTAPFVAHDISLTSGGLDAEEIDGLRITVVGAAGDLNSAPIVGIKLTDFAANGGASVGTGIYVGAAFSLGINSRSPASLYSASPAAVLALEQDGAATALTVLQNTANSVFSMTAGASTFSLANTGALSLTTLNTIAGPAFAIDQEDTDQPFINFSGTIAADTSTNISTQPGDGAVVGPKAPAAANGWAFVCMVKQQYPSGELWVPGYIPATP